MELTEIQKKKISDEYPGFIEWIKGDGKNEREEHLEHGRKIKSLTEPKKIDKQIKALKKERTKTMEKLRKEYCSQCRKYYPENRFDSKTFDDGFTQIET
ncbi:hypothetical protein KJ765_00875 [Candidatus Micrarchaeota archaeon]|nr:hypothetical protein [Candidatus Micrarchaeota archaeon]